MASSHSSLGSGSKGSDAAKMPSNKLTNSTSSADGTVSLAGFFKSNRFPQANNNFRNSATQSYRQSRTAINSMPIMATAFGNISHAAEFYLSTMWKLCPKGIDRVMKSLKRLPLERATFVYDYEVGLILTLCQRYDVDIIRAHFQGILEEIDQEEAVDEKGIINPGFQTELIACGPPSGDTEAAAVKPDILRPHESPSHFDKHPYGFVFMKLEREEACNLTIDDLIPRLDEFQAENEISLCYNLAKKKIFVASDSQEAASKTLTKLENLYFLHKTGVFSSKITAHLFYVEGYEDKKVDNYILETRLLTNVHIDLPVLTILDRVKAIGWDYKMLWDKGVVVRLCPYDPKKEHHVSDLGKREVVKKEPSLLKSRPMPSKKTCVKPSSSQVPARLQVQAWMSDVHSQDVEERQGGGSHGDESRDQATATDTVVASQRDIEERHDRVSHGNEGRDQTTSTATAVASQREASPLIDLDLNETQAADTPHSPNSQEMNFHMAPLTPEVVHHKTMRQCAGPFSSQTITQSAMFNLEMKRAQEGVSTNLEYFPGDVQIRMDLGRILLAGFDLTALAFNDPNDKSNGWSKSDIMVLLFKEFRKPDNVHFTRPMTTYASDVERVIALEDDRKKPLWNKSASSQAIVYSFYCVEKDRVFVVEITDEGKKGPAEADFTYRIRLGQDEKHVIWVHGVRRDWDLRLTTTYTDTGEMEHRYGDVAKVLIQSLANLGDGSNRIRYAVARQRGVDVRCVRTLTKWRHPSQDGQTMLDITEVQEMYLKTVERKGWDEFRCFEAAPWSEDIAKPRAAQGQPAFWYEMSIVSSEVEQLFKQNKSLQVGEKALYSAQSDEMTRGLQCMSNQAVLMLRKVDFVGLGNDNGLRGKYKHQEPNDPPGTAEAARASRIRQIKASKKTFW